MTFRRKCIANESRLIETKPMSQTLIEDYRRRLATITEEIAKVDGLNSLDAIRGARLSTKASCYRTFISELEREEANTAPLTKDERTELALLRELKNDLTRPMFQPEYDRLKELASKQLGHASPFEEPFEKIEDSIYSRLGCEQNVDAVREAAASIASLIHKREKAKDEHTEWLGNQLELATNAVAEREVDIDSLKEEEKAKDAEIERWKSLYYKEVKFYQGVLEKLASATAELSTLKDEQAWHFPSKGELPEDEQDVWIVLVDKPFLAIHYDDDGVSRFMSKETKHVYTADKVRYWTALITPTLSQTHH